MAAIVVVVVLGLIRLRFRIEGEGVTGSRLDALFQELCHISDARLRDLFAVRKGSPV